jgi:hypothetical protein
MTKAGFTAMLLTTLLLIAGCSRPQVAGKWTGSVAQTSGPNISSTIEFKPDGTVTKAIKTPAGEVSASGTYTMAGDKLTLRVSKVTTTTSAGSVTGVMSQPPAEVSAVSVQGDTLSLSQNGRTTRFTRARE